MTTATHRRPSPIWRNFGIGFGHRLGALILLIVPERRQGVEWKKPRR